MKDQIAWEESVKKFMSEEGWICDQDDEKTLGFYRLDPPAKWIRDYNKKTHRFAQFNGNQVVNLMCTNCICKNEED